MITTKPIKYPTYDSLKFSNLFLNFNHPNNYCNCTQTLNTAPNEKQNTTARCLKITSNN